MGRSALTMVLALSAASSALAASPEAGKYRFEAFIPGAEDPRLPAELRVRAPHVVAGPASPLASDRAVRLEWVTREGPGLRGYRLTATIDGGPLSGLAARWTVASGSGEPSAIRGGRSYRLSLPLPVDGRLRLHAALEAVRDDGSVVLLAVRDTTPISGIPERGLSEPVRYAAGSPGAGGSALLPTSGAALLPSGEAGVPDAGRDTLPAERHIAPSSGSQHPGRPRGPPPLAS